MYDTLILYIPNLATLSRTVFNEERTKLYPIIKSKNIIY